jgi:Cu+-exporting ATPase
MFSLKQAGSEHPLAKAIVDYTHYFLEFGGPLTLKAAHTLRSRDTSWMKSASSFENIPGKGVHCQVDNKGILVGNQKLMSNSGVAILKATEDYLQENKQWAQTVVIGAFDGAVAGVISHSDPLKQEAAVVVEGP